MGLFFNQRELYVQILVGINSSVYFTETTTTSSDTYVYWHTFAITQHILLSSQGCLLWIPIPTRLRRHSQLLGAGSGWPQVGTGWYRLAQVLSNRLAQVGNPVQILLDASSHLYKSLCLLVRPFVRPSIRPSVRPSVCPSVRHTFFQNMQSPFWLIEKKNLSSPKGWGTMI